MSTTTTTTSTSSAASLATSVKFMAFALAMGLATPILYVLCDIFGLPLFTYHPATNRVDLFWAPGRSGEGPAMYWYGWTATVLVVGAAMGIVATFFPQQKVSTFTLLLTGIVTIIIALWVFLWGGMAADLRLSIGATVGLSVLLCVVAAMRSEEANKKLLLQLLWVLPLLAFIPLWISLQPFWDKGGGFF
jgi:energy-converting hydrogenase Eha subunit C